MVAYAAIVAFVAVLVLVIGRTMALYSVLWLAPLSRLWRWLRSGRGLGSDR